MHDPVPGLPYKEPAIYVERKKLDRVNSFVYLGSTIAEGCYFDNKISLHI